MQHFTADFIFDGFRFLPKGTVISINEFGKIVDVNSSSVKSDVKHISGLLMPGMINAHCHLELSYLKGEIPKHIGLVNFLIGINTLYKKVFSNELISQKIIEAEHEMFQNGIVAVGDISNTLNSLETKKNKKLQYHTFVECFGLLDADAEKRFQNAFNLKNQFTEFHVSSVVLHAPYSVSETLIQLVNNHSDGLLSSIHNQESEEENALFKTGVSEIQKLYDSISTSIIPPSVTGNSSLESYLPKLTKIEKLILVHNTFTNKEDFEITTKTNKNIFWCLCPNANQYIENALPQIDLLLDSNCKIILGTDSLASNDALNLISEIDTIHSHFPAIKLETMLKWATWNGAEALEMLNELGSFEVGKTPGLVNIENFNSTKKLPQKPLIKRLV